MANGLNGWSHDDVTTFLEFHDFSYHKEKDGSHYSYIKRSDEEASVVEINITKGDYPPTTLLTMIGQSGIPKEHWRKWTTLNKSQKKKRVCCS